MCILVSVVGKLRSHGAFLFLIDIFLLDSVASYYGNLFQTRYIYVM